ncbi:MAG: hypothetical protein M1839_000865 [Geoglossum umbratile]|nr:MAG: hypothetical protein M1839_000865 [Geoglossum umbratile]
MPKPAKRKRKGPSVERGDPGEVPRKPKSRRVSPGVQQGTVGEQGEDHNGPERSESQQFLEQSRAFAKTLRKDNYIISFEEEVRAEGEDLLRVASSRRRDIEGIEETHQSMLKSLQTSALVLDTAHSDKGGVGSRQAISADRRASPGAHSLYAKGSSILKLCAALIDVYEGLRKDVAALDHSPLVGHTWEEDARKIEHLLEVGRKTTEDQITGHTDKATVPIRVDSTEDAQCRSRRECGWAKVAKQTSKGIKKLVKALPREKQL